ncbi:hypothetical protein ACWGNY_30730 [[Kitasatospora] papulosa]
MNTERNAVPPVQSVQEAADRIMSIGTECASRTELLHYLEELGTVASAIRHGLITASWRGMLSEGASLDDRPTTAEIERMLERPDRADIEHPGQGTMSTALANTIQLAEALGLATQTAWSAILSDETRIRVDEARKSVAEQRREGLQEVMEAIVRGLKTTLPTEVASEAQAAIKHEMDLIRQRGNGTAVPRQI